MIRRFQNEAELDDNLSQPYAALVDLMSRVTGDFMVLGVAGKMGTSLARAAARAAREAGTPREVFGVARFSGPGIRERLDEAGVRTIACDLLESDQLARLPAVPNVIFLAGRKFGTQGEAAQTWATNVLAPALVAEHFRGSRIVALSTGCVYPLVSPASAGCSETEKAHPLGEYAQSCLGRERLLEYASLRHRTPVCLVRLNYAIDLRYGVLHDIARSILANEPVDLAMGHFNCLWQGDAVNRILLALDLCVSPPDILNLTGPEILVVREVAEQLAQALGCGVRFKGEPQGSAYLSNAERSTRLWGPPRVSVQQMIEWTASWMQSGGRSLQQPTHFEVRDGRF